MGNTTIIELNHDRFMEIENNRDLFVDQILTQLKLGYDYEQEIEGGRIIAFFPRYNDNKKYRAWNRWLIKWINRRF